MRKLLKLNSIKLGFLTILFCLPVFASEGLQFPNKFKFKKKIFHKHTGPSNHISGIDSNRNYTDLDGDGVFDLVDPDIDGDGVINFMDEAPLNKKSAGKDRDKDGIPDFLDFKVKSKLKEKMSAASARLQQQVFKKNGIIIFNGDQPFSNSEFQKIANLFLQNELKNFPVLPNLKVIFKQPLHSMGHKAKFRDSHKAIILFQNMIHENSPLEQELTVVHESFHALSYERPELWNEFLDLSGWGEEQEGDILTFKEHSFHISDFKTNSEKISSIIEGHEFPSEYSKMGPDEMFAECATASLMSKRGDALLNKYPYLAKYHSTAVHSFFLNHFRSLFN